MTWLNQNASAVQAFAALVVMLLTGLLAIFTYKYVSLTGTIATAAQQQVDLARSQETISKNLAIAAEEQRKLNGQRVDELKDKEKDSREAGERTLDMITARLLIQLSAASSNPELDYLQNMKPISEATLNSVRAAAEQAKKTNVGELEGALTALEDIAALQIRATKNTSEPYEFSDSEKDAFATNLRNARALLRGFTSFRPPNERY